MENIHRINSTGLLQELMDWSEDYSKKIFRSKVQRIYTKCLIRNKILLATKIAAKYRTELTETLRSDMSIACQYALFASRVIQK